MAPKRIPNVSLFWGVAALGLQWGAYVVPHVVFDLKNASTAPPKWLQGPKIASKMIPKVQKMTPTMHINAPTVLLKVDSVGTLKMILIMAWRTARSALSQFVGASAHF